MSSEKSKTTLIIGASDNPERYSYLAMKDLCTYGHQVLLYNPRLEQVNGILAQPSLLEIDEEIDTVTIYVNPSILDGLMDDIIALTPKRVIFNPGAESSEHAEFFREAGIEVVEGCTLVMLRSEQF